MEESPQLRQQPAPQTPARNKHPRGPRQLCLTRREAGFGFTLRHFLVYPPESYRLCTNARTNPDEPMETIFVKGVHPGSAAQQAGLATGDRLISVNGETIYGNLTYSSVVQIIQNTPDRLRLVVVPKEYDVIQQNCSDAHHPKTNTRPRLRSPEVGEGLRRESSCSPVGLRSHSTANEPIYHMPNWTDRSSGNWSTSRRLSDVSEPVIAQPVGIVAGGVSHPALSQPGCRLSLDGSRFSSSAGSVNSFDSNSTLTDDSIHSRIRRICEQKDEFLRSTVKPMYPPLRENGTDERTEGEVIAREFYARPQRMAQPLWPPDERGRAPLRTLTRIHEGSPADAVPNRISYGSNSFDSDPGETGRSLRHSLRSRSEENDGVTSQPHRTLTAPLVQMVSHRARQFESGQLDEDRVNMYRSELARLTGKHAVPNVAVRRQEYEQRSSQERSSRLSDLSPPPQSPPVMSGNRTVPIGSKQLHALPPEGYRDLSAGSTRLDERRRRGRSVSTERWASLDENQSPHLSTLSPPNERRSGQAADRRNSLSQRFSHTQRLSPPLDKQRHKAVRQDSYLAAVKTIPGPTASRARRIVRRQPSLDSADLETLKKDIVPSSLSKPRAVRPRKLSLRSVSPFAISEDASGDESTSQVPVSTVPITTTADSSSVVRRAKASSLTVDERTTRRFSYIKATLADRGHDPDHDIPPPTKSGDPSDIKDDVIREGWLHCKVRATDGKRATDRSWKQLWAVLRGHVLTLYKDRRDVEVETLDIKGCYIDVPTDYKKRNNVLQVRTPADSEYLLQAEDSGDMEQWRRVLLDIGEIEQDPARCQSPSGQSPINKTRKASQSTAVPEPVQSPKSKTWKGKLGKPFWRIQSGASSPSSPTYPEGATIGVPLDVCPASLDNPFVPLLVVRCTAVVEALGLDIVGVYRVPGNTAQMTALTEAINKLGIHNIPPEDPRWKEVNVISSLLKLFFRKLPDPLFTAEMYPKFIMADKLPDQKARMECIRKLFGELPPHNYETLKHVLYHLKTVVSNSSTNKMESKNLAIVFGPTLLGAAELLTMVQDTHHQCRIIESLISHVDWFFSDDDVDCLEPTSLPMCPEGLQVSDTPQNVSLLLNNLSKVGGYAGEYPPGKDINRKDIMSSIINAASRVSKSKSKKPEKAPPPYTHIIKSKEGHSEMTAARAIATSVLPGVIGAEMMRDGSAALTQDAEPGPQQPGVMPHDQPTLDRIRRFEIETQAMLTRDPVRMRRATDRRAADQRTFDTHITSDLTSSKEMNLTRKVGSCESLHDDVTSLKRFKSSREDCSSNKFGSLDSLQAVHADDGHDLVITLTETFDQKLQVIKSKDSIRASHDDMTKAEKEVQKSKEEEKDKDSLEEGERNREETWKDVAETWREWEARVLMPRNDNARVKRSESLNKTDKPDIGPKVRRSESLGKTDIRRTDSLTKNEKTETNMKAKLKRSSSKEKENSAARLKRIKRRHTVGGTKDLDKLPWHDNRLYTEELERQAANKQTRTSSPDLSTPKLRNSIANELISLGIEEQAAVKAANAHLATPSAGTALRPQSMPPPLESQL